MKKIFALVLALILALSCCALAEEEEYKIDPVATITAVRTEVNPASQNYPEGDDQFNNVWTRYYRDAQGIDLQYEWVAADDQYNEKVNLMIAAGNIPDVFSVTDTQFQQLYEADLLADLTEAFDTYATDYTKMVMFESGDAAYNSAMRDGKLMAIPFTGMPRENVQMLVVRKDWEDQLGLTGINTWDDMAAYMAAFKGLGEDKVGMSCSMDLGWFNTLAAAFNAYPQLWVEVDGALANGAVQPETREALLAVQKLYADGLIDPEFGTHDGSKVNEMIASGRSGISIGIFSAPLSRWQNCKNNFPETELNFYPIATPDGNAAIFGHDLGVQSYWVVSKECEHPEAAVLMLNTYMKFFYAVTDDELYTEYQNGTDGSEIWQNSFVRIYRGFKNLDIYRHFQAYKAGEMTFEELTAEERGVWTRSEAYRAGDNSLWCWDMIYGDVSTCAVVNYYKDNDLFLLNGFTGTPTEGMVENKAILDKLQLETFTKIIQGTDISEFDSFVETWNALGGDEITEEVNAWKAAQ